MCRSPHCARQTRMREEEEEAGGISGCACTLACVSPTDLCPVKLSAPGSCTACRCPFGHVVRAAGVGRRHKRVVRRVPPTQTRHCRKNEPRVFFTTALGAGGCSEGGGGGGGGGGGWKWCHTLTRRWTVQCILQTILSSVYMLRTSPHPLFTRCRSVAAHRLHVAC